MQWEHMTKFPPALLERVFKIEERGSSLKTEIFGGLTLFMATVPTIVPVAVVLSVGGLPIEHGVLGGAWAGCIGHLLVGLLSNLPLSVSAASGPDLTVAYILAQSMASGGLGGYTQAMTCCLCSGFLIVGLAAVGAVELLTMLVPESLKIAICAGIGLLIALVGFQQVGMAVHGEDALLGTGDFAQSPQIWLCLASIVLVTVLSHIKFKGAVLIMVLLVTVIGWSFISGWPSVEVTPLRFPHWSLPDLACLALPDFWLQVVSMTVYLVLDSMGCACGLAKQAKCVDETGQIMGGNRFFVAVGLGTSFAALCGVSPVVVNGPSTTAIMEGTRTGLGPCVCGLLFLVVGAPLALVLAELPTSAVSFVLIFSGLSMFRDVGLIDWQDSVVALPAFLCIIAQPYLFSIANGIYMGLGSSLLLNLLTGRVWRNWQKWLASRTSASSKEPGIAGVVVGASNHHSLEGGGEAGAGVGGDDSAPGVVVGASEAPARTVQEATAVPGRGEVHVDL